MKLPDNVDELSASFTRIAPKRKAQILEHLRLTDGARGQATVAQLIANGGPEGEFVQHLFGKDAPDRGAAPENKKINPPNVKGDLEGGGRFGSKPTPPGPVATPAPEQGQDIHLPKGLDGNV